MQLRSRDGFGMGCFLGRKNYLEFRVLHLCYIHFFPSVNQLINCGFLGSTLFAALFFKITIAGCVLVYTEYCERRQWQVAYNGLV